MFAESEAQPSRFGLVVGLCLFCRSTITISKPLLDEHPDVLQATSQPAIERLLSSLAESGDGAKGPTVKPGST